MGLQEGSNALGPAADERDLEDIVWQLRQRIGKNGGERDAALRLSQGSTALNPPAGMVKRGMQRTRHEKSLPSFSSF